MGNFVFLFCSVYSERSKRVALFFPVELEFHRLEFHWKIFFLRFALFTQRGPIGLLSFALFFPVELESINFFSSFCSVYLERSKRVALFFPVELEFHRLEFHGIFFFLVLLCFPLLIPGIIHWGIFFSFLLVMQTNQKLKRVHAPGEKQR